ncbi:Cytidylate kinase [Indibacter alkaliphilus LW1]|jgi:cytidylate kinase|uniref:Cytidylate kinase n=1 Tax=Indibacter alkaliphilus (strain CCUG 57479 / KCTC 22604 / LW1) TaxID=1189612 RepID=S2E524_INDAL|nr:(d)CMP kinase [Indibacter alkaliphilus]EOZ99691.1 Cytidylate kinase [Indibacter alkaliphilus LW1]
MHKIVIAIDGYSGCGKSSTAKSVAKELGYTYIDSGAMYRAATLHFLNHQVAIDKPEQVKQYLAGLNITFMINPETKEQETYLNGVNVEEEIRTMRVSDYVSEVSKIKEVRTELVSQQQKLGKSKGVVMDGRDIGTVVFPEAELKVFMTADLEIRAKRRQKELQEKGAEIALEKILSNLAERDKIDSGRKESPLVKASDAVEVDTSHLQFEEQVNQIVALANDRIAVKQD